MNKTIDKQVSSAIIPFPELDKIKENLEKLRTELSMLVLERDELIYVICKNLEIETDEERSCFVTRLFIHPGFMESNQVNNQVIIANGDDNGDEAKVLNLLKIEPAITARKMSEKLKVSPRKISRIIKSLRESGEIVRIGSDRKGYWEIK